MSPNDKETNDAIMLYEKALTHQQSGEIDNAIKSVSYTHLTLPTKA